MLNVHSFEGPTSEITYPENNTKALLLFNTMQITDPRLYYIDENYCIRNLMTKSLKIM